MTLQEMEKGIDNHHFIHYSKAHCKPFITRKAIANPNPQGGIVMPRILLVAGLALAGLMALAAVVVGNSGRAELVLSRADSVLPPPLNTCS